jgi:hypothetical protein
MLFSALRLAGRLISGTHPLEGGGINVDTVIVGTGPSPGIQFTLDMPYCLGTAITSNAPRLECFTAIASLDLLAVFKLFVFVTLIEKTTLGRRRILPAGFSLI